MASEKATTSPCNKFQANMFNKSKCQNCFKSRELHLLGDRGREQAKPVYGGWLCLAPEGTDFDNPTQRSRKWQRRFFILYEDGRLSFALDELPSTLPQGTVNVNMCTDMADAEPRTGQRNALCIVTPEQELFIRGDNKDVINGWSDRLAVYLRANKQNPKKKRKVEPVATQEPSPAKMAATDSSFLSSESARWQEDHLGRVPTWTATDTGPSRPRHQTPAGSTSPYLCSVSRDSLASDGSFVNPVSSLDLVASGNGNNRQTETSGNSRKQQDNSHDSPSERIVGSEAVEEEQAVSRKGRSETRSSRREALQSCGDVARLGAATPQRRTRSLDRRTSDTVMTLDLLNFKKGWMVKLDSGEQWRKYWFVLSADSLRFYKDSIAEEASDLEGDIDLTKCYNVSEYQVQRNYGFQIHTPNGIYTLSAMTSGIRKNWIQALMKNVHLGHAPGLASPPDPLPRPDVTQDSPFIELPADPHPKRRTATERRRDGRYKTFDWAEFSPQDAGSQREAAPSPLELGELERTRRREERRRRYESMLGISLCWQVSMEKVSGLRALSPKSRRRVEDDMEECWRLVEKTVFRQDRNVPLLIDTKRCAGAETLLDSYRKEVEDLKAQLEESERCRLQLEAQLSTAGCLQQPDLPTHSEAGEMPSKSHTQNLEGAHEHHREPFQQQNASRRHQLGCDPPSLTPQTPSILLQDTEGTLHEPSLLPDTEATTLLLPASGDSFSQSDGETRLHGDGPQAPSSQTQISYRECSPVLEEQLEEERRMSRELKLLTSQNQALNQHNQEMLNQLTEAEREIERLKAELGGRHAEQQRFPEDKQPGHACVEELERELSLRNQELLEAQTLISSLEGNLRETETLLQLDGTGQEDKAQGYLLGCLEAAEAKLSELERQLGRAEATCEETRKQNAELKEAEQHYRHAAAEAEADVRRLNEELEEERLKCGGEEKIQQVIEGMVARLNALGKLLEVMDKSSVGWRKESEGEELSMESELKWEEEFWSSLHTELNSQCDEEKEVEELLSKVTEHMRAEKQMLLFGLRLLPEQDEGLTGSADVRICDFNNQLSDIKQLRAVTQVEISSLNHLASAASSSAQNELRLMAGKLFPEHARCSFIHSAATEALYCCRLNRLQWKHKRELEELASSIVCSNCVELAEQNGELRARLSNREERPDQTKDADSEEADQSPERFTQDESEQETAEAAEGEERAKPRELDGMEIPPPLVDCPLDAEDTEKSDASLKETDCSLQMEEVLVLRGRVEELEEQLTVWEELKEQFDGKMSSVQTQHDKEMEKLKVTCERGLASMEESHMKMVEELQRRHQQEVERILAERDRLLEEESAATATAIEAIRNAHQLELEKEAQRRSQAERSTGNAHLEEVYRRHSEELTSFQQELQVLSQQFSLRCLENGHLVQALDAERKALCQCQQENQDLRTRNQELSGHLAAEITRLCSLAKQDELPLSQGMDVYEMEITLRVKESEVQSLKQENASLKDELQLAQRDKRNATKMYKDVLTELSITRTKAARELGKLRENLKLAHLALDPPSP